MHPLALIVALALGACATVETISPRPIPRPIAEPHAHALHYIVRVGPELTHAQVQMCVGPASPPECVQYEVELARATTRWGGIQNRTLVLEPDKLLRKPEGLRAADPRRITLEFHAAPEIRLSVPWEKVGETYELPAHALLWRAHLAIGILEIQTVETAGAVFEIAIAGGARRATNAGITQWISGAAEAVATIHTRFPRKRVQVLVLPVRGGSDPVVFGMATRGGGPGILLLLGNEAEDHELPNDWVAPHELFHLGFPRLRPEDAWLSEGFSTYYTQVARARAGLTPTAARTDELESDRRSRWFHEQLGWGLERAARSMSGRSLVHPDGRGRRGLGYTAVYWGGAAVAAALDQEIRRRSVGSRSLDDLVRALDACCTDQISPMSSSEVVRKLDQEARSWEPSEPAWMASFVHNLALDPTGAANTVLAAPHGDARLCPGGL